ncbi:MAG: isoleucine--tRNA ligase [Proteobacteria bacterium]|nr:isoleucine--tRNA ligase [Pseudomonadota bacterium]MCP4916921.1 isoleucine--tRNA ligase [Pseudomonadota bacterium]
MFKELSSPVELEAEVLEFWDREQIFEKSLEQTKDAPEFVFYEGPPTANGTPHNGHVLTRVIKDLFPRYKTMQGFHVHRKAGWDTHGLPVEVEVEKNLGIHGREAIEEYGLEPFARKCIDSVFTYTEVWESLTRRLAFWVDTEDAYVTYHRSYIESVWWALSKLFEKGLLYQGHKVVWWWPQGGTTLSAAEVGLGYKQVDDPSVTVAFQMADDDDLYLLAWTTTPWTLPSNTAIAVNPKLDYVVVQVGDRRLVVAEGLKDQVEGEVVQTLKGAELIGRHYKPLYDFATPEEGDYCVVIPGAHVTLEAGTGLVHTAPAFGEDDFKAAKDHGVGMLQLIAPNGKFVPGTGFLEGQFCKDADKAIIRDLKERGVLFKRETYRHDYPFCWRKDDDPLIQYARPAWFVKTTALNAEAIANNKAVNWAPEHIKEGRFGDFLRNNVDWALSRERFWGTPLNIWVCPECEAHKAPASVAAIRKLNADKGLPDPFDPDVDEHLQVHRPWIDRVTLPCDCGATMDRVPEVIDCWFDSGSMPFAQWGFPHAEGSKEIFEKRFPADFISEAVDQTRGWFYSLLMISTLLFDDETCAEYDLKPVGLPRPYKNCVVLGHVCDMEGKKESKSKGNYTSPDLVMKGEMTLKVQVDEAVPQGSVGFMKAQLRSLDLGKKECFKAGDVLLKPVKADVKVKDTIHLNPNDASTLAPDGTITLKAPFAAPGADAFRWLFYASNPPWSNTRNSLKSIREGQREFLMRLKNVHSFFAIYANIAGFDANAPGPALADRDLLDRWIVGELDSLNADVVRYMDDYKLYEAARRIQEFVEGLSNWYVRRSRRRFWDESPAALTTLHEVLARLSKLIAPFVPFMAEALHQDLRRDDEPQSVHLCAYPSAGEAYDADLDAAMGLVREVASLGLAARKHVGVRVRQPLRAVEVVLADPSTADSVDSLAGLLIEELNVREVRFSQEAETFVSFQVKPNYKALGRRLGKDMKVCAGMLAKMPGSEVRKQVLGGGLELELPSGPVTLGQDEIIVGVQAREGFEAAGSARAVVVLHAELDDDLRQEGLAREVINRIQGLRKEHRLGYTDRIQVHLSGDDELVAAVDRFREHVAGETLATGWIDAAPDTQSIDVDGRELRLGLVRVG